MLTTRAAVLGLVVVTLVVSIALPVREYLTQQAGIDKMERAQAQSRDRVQALEQAKRQLEDPAYVAAEARRRLRLAKPGETTYLLVPPDSAPVAGQAPSVAPVPAGPWYSQLWSSVQAADRPVPAPGP